MKRKLYANRTTRIALGLLALIIIAGLIITPLLPAPGQRVTAANPTATIDTTLADGQARGESPTATIALPTATPQPPTPQPAPTDAALDPALTARSDSLGLMGRGNLQRTGVYATAGVHGPISLRWQITMPEGIFATPAVAGATIYAASGDGTVYAAETAHGHVKWQFQADDWVLTSPAVAHGLVFFGSRAGTFYALDARTGAERWTAVLGGEIYAAPLVADGWLYTASGDGMVHALDAQTGASRWTFQAPASVYTPPALADGTLFVGDADGGFYALDAQTGSPRWQVATDAGIVTAPAVATGLVYTGTTGGTLYGIDTQTGEVRWQAAVGSALSAPAVAAGHVVVIATDGKVYAFDAASGAEQWQVQGEGRVFSTDLLAPTIADSLVYVGSDGVAPADPEAVVLTTKADEERGFLHALDLATGAVQWQQRTRAAVRSAPAIADGVLYVGDAGGTLYALWNNPGPIADNR